VKLPSISPRWYIPLALIAFIVLSLLFRIALPYHQIFTDEGIKYASNDSYTFMRMVDNWVYNFPHVTGIDVYRIYPGNPGAVGFSFFNWMIAFISWLLGLGSPSQHLIDVVGVCFPAVLGALTVIPAYFLGKTLFNRAVGLLAAALMVVMPGEFLGRSILGFTDYHVAETLFSMTAALFLILAVKTAGARQLTWGQFRRRDFKPALKPLLFGLLGGFFLALYLLTWQGASLFVFIITLYFVVQFIIDHLKKRSSDYLGIAGFTLFFVALLICLPFSMPGYIVIGLVVAMLVPPALSAVSWLVTRLRWRPYFYPLVVVGLGAAFIAVFYAVAPSTFNIIMDRFKFIFLPSGATAATTMEMQPLLAPDGYFTTGLAWGNFTTSFFLIRGWPIPGFGIIAFFILVWLYIKNRAEDKTLLFFFFWTLVIFIATLIQRRFCYYLVVNLSLLSAYISWQIIWQAGLKKVTLRRQEAAALKLEKKKPRKESGFSIYHVNVILAVIAVFFLVFFWNITRAKDTASHVYYAPSDAWQASLVWMRDNTPEPFGDPSVYYDIYEPAASGPNFVYPDSAYGVTAWWDYGYWISRTARRLPNANPAQATEPIQKVAVFFLSGDDATRDEIRQELDSSYVIIDYDLTSLLSKFSAVVTWADRSQNEFAGVYYYVDNNNQLVPAILYYPEYYRTLMVRLYNFNGEAVSDVAPLVVTYEDRATDDGYQYRLLTDAYEATSYQDALDYMAEHASENCLLVGQDPFVSPVALDAVSDYELVYSSDPALNSADITDTSEIKIFHYTGSD
jgi:dolichyl-diphosphooligosaccharide--protein glycosyltransferase